MERIFPDSHLNYSLLSKASIDVPRFRRYTEAVRALERTRTLLDCNRSWIGEEVSLGGTDRLRGFLENLEHALCEAGWGEASKSALYHSMAGLGYLRQAVLLVFPDCTEMSEERTLRTLLERF